MTFTITIDGSDRNERRRLLDLIRGALDADGKYVCSRGVYPLEGSISFECFRAIDPAKIYSNMSVSACVARFIAARDRIRENIRAGRISASMSGIEHYWCPVMDLDSKDLDALETLMRWNGETRIDRPDWLAEFKAWKIEQETP